MHRSTRLLALPLLGTFLACGTQSPRDIPKNQTGITLVQRTSLEARLGSEAINVTGVTVDPDDNQRYILDATAGIYRLDDDKAVLVAGLQDLFSFVAAPGGEFTDIVAIGDGKFALTAVNDGFLFDSKTKSFERYFCYVPGDIIDPEAPIPVMQLTRSVTYDKARNKLYAQPQTFREGLNGPPEAAEVGQFDIEGGEGYGWISIDDAEFSAGGIAVGADGKMLLAEGSTLYRLDLDSGEFEMAYDLSRFDVTDVGGLAVVSNRVLVVDSGRRELLEIEIN